MPAWLAPAALGAVGALGGALGAKKARKEAQAAGRQQAQFRADTQGARDVLAGQIAGTGPSVAAMQQQQGMDASNRQMISAAAAGGGPLAWRSAQMQQAQNNGAMAGQLALTRANEQQAAIGQQLGLAQTDYEMSRQVAAAQAANKGWFNAALGGAASGAMAGLGFQQQQAAASGAKAEQAEKTRKAKAEADAATFAAGLAYK